MSLPAPSLEAGVLYDLLTARGVTLYTPGDGRLRFKPRSRLSSEEVAKLKEHKTEILELLRTENAASPSVPCVPPPSKADKTALSGGTQRGDAPEDACVPRWAKEQERRYKQRADERGLVSRFSSEFGYIALHDPTTGEWVEVEFKEAPPWAKREAFRRKDLRKAGKRHDLTAREMEEVWKREQTEMWTAPAPLAEGRKAGLIYDDDVVEED